MITAIDTNILIDIFGADQKFGHSSAKALKQCKSEGGLCACEIVWTETAVAFPKANDFLAAMEEIGIEFSPLSKEASLKAATAWRRYRQSGGKRERVVADFLIGAHALENGYRLISRDRGFYRKYFHELKLINPIT